MNRPFSFDDAAFLALGTELGEADATEVLQVFLADTADKFARLAANSQARPLIKREAQKLRGDLRLQ